MTVKGTILSACVDEPCSAIHRLQGSVSGHLLRQDRETDLNGARQDSKYLYSEAGAAPQTSSAAPVRWERAPDWPADDQSVSPVGTG